MSKPLKIGALASADPVQAHDEGPLWPAFRAAQNLTRPYKPPVEVIQRKNPVAPCKREFTPSHTVQRFRAHHLGPVARGCQPARIDPEAHGGKGGSQSSDKMALRDFAREGVEIGKVDGGKWMKPEEGLDYGEWIAARTQGGFYGPVVLALSQTGADGHTALEVDHRYDMHGAVAAGS